jgi:hypothetical protein
MSTYRSAGTAGRLCSARCALSYGEQTRHKTAMPAVQLCARKPISCMLPAATPMATCPCNLNHCCRLSVLHRHRLGTTAAQSYPAMFAKVRVRTVCGVSP